MVAQGRDATDVNAGDGGSAKVDGDAIGLLVIQRVRQAARGLFVSIELVIS
jgi:hypothetical protein